MKQFCLFSLLLLSFLFVPPCFAEDYDFLISNTAGSNESLIRQFSWDFQRGEEILAIQLKIWLPESEVLRQEEHFNFLSEIACSWGPDFRNELGLCGDETAEESYIALCRNIYEHDESNFDSVAMAFLQITDELNLNNEETLRFIVSFVQSIPYRLPGGNVDIYPPTLELALGFGDCDSSAILAYTLLNKMGFEVLILASEEYRHAALGVSLPAASGFSFPLDGKDYYFVELTSEGYSIGQIQPQMTNLDFWYAFKL